MSTKTERLEDLERWSRELAHSGKYADYEMIEIELRGQHASEARDYFRNKNLRKEINRICQRAIVEKINEICGNLVADLRDDIPELITHDVADGTGLLISDQGLRVRVDENVLDKFVLSDRSFCSDYYQEKPTLIGILQENIASGSEEAHITHDDLWPTDSG